MLKNKKIVLSSIAIIFTLVVSSIFVNYTLANSDSQTSKNNAGSSSTKSLTGLSNIDLAVKNSNNADKKETGEDKYRIVQIVPDSYSSYAAADSKLKAEVTSGTYTGTDADLAKDASTTYLWKYVYAGEYFRLAVFNGYKTISDEMAEGAVTLTTCTVSELNGMDTDAQAILSQADFIYIWANSASDYRSSDLSEDLFNWLDAYATSDSYPLAICKEALCVDQPSTIVGNNDTYRMGALAYKVMTKGCVARTDNILVTDPDFFKTLYDEASDNIVTPDITNTEYTLSDFILNATRTASEGGKDYINYGTYYKWYDGVAITDFLDGNVGKTQTDSTYDKAGSRAGVTGDRKEWNFDNAKVLIISEGASSTKSSNMFDEMKEINSSTISEENYVLKDGVWKSVEKAPNSELTGHMYSRGISSGTGLSSTVPSGADLYLIDSDDLTSALTDGKKTYSNIALSTSYFEDVETTSISGIVRLSDINALKKSGLDMSTMNVYLIAKTGSTYSMTGSSAEELYTCPLKATKIDTDEVLMEDGSPVLDSNGNPEMVQETAYTYSFTALNPDYEYQVVLGTTDELDFSQFAIGVADAPDTDNAAAVGITADTQCDFYIQLADDKHQSDYSYRVQKENEKTVSGTVTLTDAAKQAGVDGTSLNAYLIAKSKTGLAQASDADGNVYVCKLSAKEITKEVPNTTEEPSTEATTEDASTEASTDASTEATTEDASTEATTEDASTEASTDASTEATTDAGTEASSEDASTEAPTEDAEASVADVDDTESTTDASTEATTEATTEAASTEATTEDASTEASTEDASTEDTTEEPGTTTVTETVYTYEFTGLDENYEYQVVIGADDFDYDAYVAGIADNTGADGSASDYQFDFSIKAAEDANQDGYTYRVDNSETHYDTIVTIKDFNDNLAAYNEGSATVGLNYAYYSDSTEAEADVVVNKNLLATIDDFYENQGAYLNGETDGIDGVYSEDVVDVDLSTFDKIKTYVEKRHQTYADTQQALYSNPKKINIEDFDFVFIDKGSYSSEIGKTVYDLLNKEVEAGLYFIVSSGAGDGKGSQKSDGNSGSNTPVVTSPSAKLVADVINASKYREGADNKYRVLEIQPDYPIDLEVASSESSVETAYTERSDGSSITGNYYTVPSDVVKGKTKEELAEATEYYQFDLTKAKIAYAIDGISYGDVEITQVSTEQLIGMTEDIASRYDLVYIGGDISAVDRAPSQMYRNQKQIESYSGYTYSFFPTFIMYYHTGMLNKVTNGSYSMDTAKVGSHLLATPYIGGNYYETTYVVENGNDLTETKYDELVKYLAMGKPVMVSDELSSVYDNMQGKNASGEGLSMTELLQGYWYNNGKLERKNYYLDPSSRMYTLLGNIYSRYTSTDENTDNVLWGLDVDDTQDVSDPDGEYGTSLYSYLLRSDGSKDWRTDESAQQTTWYYKTDSNGVYLVDDNGNYVLKTDDPTVFYTYKVVFSDSTNVKINDLIASSTMRTRLNFTNSPVTYNQKVESTFIKKNTLSWTFQVDGNDATYNWDIYVDVDKNTTFDSSDLQSSGQAKNGTETSVTVALNEDFFGSAMWYLKITDDSGNLVASSSGLSKIVNNQDTKSKISVLQIQTMSEGQDSSSWSSHDTLYFDIDSQLAHKIVKYNVYANQTDFSNAAPNQYAALGRHENRFGIYEYDKSTASDDYFSNIADTLEQDYDVDLDMVVASADKASFTTSDSSSKKVTDSYDCIDTMVEEAEILKAGGKVKDMDGVERTQADYKTLASTALTEYTNAAAKVTSPQEDLNTYLQGAVTLLKTTSSKTGDATYGNRSKYRSFLNGFNGNTTDAEIVELLEFVMETEDYAMMFWPVYSKNSDIFDSNGEIGLVYGSEFRDLFIAYRNAKDTELAAKDKYNTYLRRSYGKDFLKKMYSILVIGPSDSFGGFKVDLKAKTCEYILDYVNNGGDMFFFHDSMTPFADAGAVNLTKSLLSIVGMNRFHVDVTNNANSYTVTGADYATGSYSAGLVNGTVGDDGTMYVKYNISQGLEQGTLYEDGYIYEKSKFDSTEGLVYSSNISAGSEYYYYVAGTSSAPLTERTLEAGDYVYEVMSTSNMHYAMTSVEGWLNVDSGNPQYTYYNSGGTYQPNDGYEVVGGVDASSNMLVYSEDGGLVKSNVKYVRKKLYGTSSQVGTVGLTEMKTVTKSSYINEGGNTVNQSANFVKLKASADNTAGYELQTAEYFSYYEYNGVHNGFFTKKQGKAGDTGFVMVNADSYTYYDSATDTWAKTGYFMKVENVAAGTSGYVWRDAGNFYNGQGAGTSTDVQFKSSDASLYYMTPYAFNTTYGKGLINSINANMVDWQKSSPSTYIAKMSKDTNLYVSALSMTPLYQNGNDVSETTALPYVYAQEQFQSATAWSMASNSDESANSETVKADQLNSGLVTMYPYAISSTLNISGTHQQAYALDLESDNVTVWYTLAGSNNSNSAKTRSSKYAASPGDAMESYFIYTTSYGSGAITYCGAGHTSVTGDNTNNNDERMLFINVIINSASAIPDKPTIKAYEPTETYSADDELSKDAEAAAKSGKTVYELDVDAKTDTPEFDLKVTMPSTTKVTKISVYYDLDYDDKNGYTTIPSYANDDKHHMIAEITKQGTKNLSDIESQIKQTIRNDKDNNLALKDEYFAAYGGTYTYIVVAVEYEGMDPASPAYVMIKVKAGDPLFDLTQNTIDAPISIDYIAESRYVFKTV